MPGVLLLSAIPAVAAAAYSADIELVDPAFAPGAVLGVDNARPGSTGNVRVGTLFQYTLDPLVYSEGGEEIGAAVANRATLQLGVAWEVTRRFEARLRLPLADQWGASAADTLATGAGTGDLGMGGRFTLVRIHRFALAATADVRLPTGTQGAWLGEEAMRGGPGLDVSGSVGRFDLLADAGALLRAPVATVDDFTLGTELSAGAAVRARLVPDRLAVALAGVGRVGLAASGAAELPAEGLLDVQAWPVETFQVDLGVGHGLSRGYGSSRFRAFAGLTWTYRRPKQEATAAPVATEPIPSSADLLKDADDVPPPPTPVAPPAPPAPPPPVQWDKGELARVEHNQILIREPIAFAKSDSEIRASSRPVVDAIAQRLADHPEILAVVIEGHSSEEGGFAFNYELSMKRALTVYRALIEGGVDAQRLSVRGLGEVVPVAGDAADQRSVVFHIVRRLEPGETPPSIPPSPVPWTGEKR